MWNITYTVVDNKTGTRIFHPHTCLVEAESEGMAQLRVVEAVTPYVNTEHARIVILNAEKFQSN